MTVDFGMNDGGYQPFNEGRFKTYMNGLQGMADQAKAAKIRVGLDHAAAARHRRARQDEPNATTRRSKNSPPGVKEIAQKNDGLFVDQFHPYLAVLNKARGEIGQVQPHHRRRRRPPRRRRASRSWPRRSSRD